MKKTTLTIISVLSFALFGCASGADAAPPEGSAEEARTPDLDRRPLILESDEELRAFVDEFSLVVEDATLLLTDLRQGAFEEEVDRIDGLRGRLDRWRDIAENASINPDSTEISPEGYEGLTAELSSLRSRLWEVVLQINREIAEATGVGPEEPGPEHRDTEG